MVNKMYRELHGKIVGAGMTDREVATAIGISPQAMSDKILGKTQFTIKEMVATGKYLDLTSEEYYNLFLIPAQNALDLVRSEKENHNGKSSIRTGSARTVSP